MQAGVEAQASLNYEYIGHSKTNLEKENTVSSNADELASSEFYTATLVNDEGGYVKDDCGDGKIDLLKVGDTVPIANANDLVIPSTPSASSSRRALPSQKGLGPPAPAEQQQQLQVNLHGEEGNDVDSIGSNSVDVKNGLETDHTEPPLRKCTEMSEAANEQTPTETHIKLVEDGVTEAPPGAPSMPPSAEKDKCVEEPRGKKSPLAIPRW